MAENDEPRTRAPWAMPDLSSLVFPPAGRDGQQPEDDQGTDDREPGLDAELVKRVRDAVREALSPPDA